MKQRPTNRQIKDFMELVYNESEKVLVVGEYVTNNQLSAIRDYGQFLALIPEDKYEEEIFRLINKIKEYNLRLDKALFELKEYKIFQEEREALLQRATRFRKSIISPDEAFNQEIEHNLSNAESNYFEFIELLDMYIEDLKINEYSHSNYKILPLTQFANSKKSVKTPIKECINRILNTYGIKNYSKEAKALIDRLDNPSE